jgi:nicotinamide riboside kinase
MRLCVTGPESTGKTTLSRQLAEALGSRWIPEAARVYAERVGRELTAADVELIAREHLELASGDGDVVLDTDLLSTIVYAEHYYGLTVPWIEEEARRRLADVYFLCDIDVPWVPDGIRDRPENRAELLELFRSTLDRFRAKTVLVRGDEAGRLELALVTAERQGERR